MIKVDENGVNIDGTFGEVIIDLGNVVDAIINNGAVDKKTMREIFSSDDFWNYIGKNYTCKKKNSKAEK